MIAAHPSEPLLAAISEHLVSLITERGDDKFAHVSDCYGCDRATWERRQGGYVPAVREPQSCLKMALGNDVERYVCDALQAHYEGIEWSVSRNGRIAWDPYKGRCRSVDEAYQATATEMLGHYDFFAVGSGDTEPESVLIECKSTSFFKGRLPTEPSLHYVEQTATYAIALGATKAGIIIACRESGRIAGPFWLDLDALEFATIERAKAVIEQTSSLIPPPAVPRYAWQVKYCGMGAACPCAKAAKADTAEQLKASLAI